jgi:hypothetical protein
MALRIVPHNVFPDRQHTHRSSRPLSRRVVAVQVEADGDLHIALGDATNQKLGIVVCEVPAEPLTIGEFRERLHSGNIYVRKYYMRAYS